MDPIEMYNKVKDLIKPEVVYYGSYEEETPDVQTTVKFSYDVSTEKSIAVREALAKLPAKAFAVGGTVVREEDILDPGLAPEWQEFLLPGKDSSSDEEKVEELEAFKETLKQGLPVDAIMDIAQPAPFGKGDKTVLDPSVRAAYEISAENIPDKLFGHKSTYETKIEEQIINALCPPNVKWTFNLYKMHIYKAGGKFLPHRDTLHDANHVATCVLSLPTTYEGGLLVIRHQGREKKFNLSNEDKTSINYCAFFTDCEHEIEEVTSGTRIVVQYDIYEEKLVKHAKTDQGVLASTSDLVRHWKHEKSLSYPDSILAPPSTLDLSSLVSYAEELPEKTCVALQLEHSYALSALEVGALKGRDVHLYHELMSSGQWSSHLQGMILKCSTDYEGDWQTLQVIPITLGDFGQTTEESCTLTSYDEVRVIPCASSKPPKKLAATDYVEYTGNESAPGHLAYYACCIVLIPVMK